MSPAAPPPLPPTPPPPTFDRQPPPPQGDATGGIIPYKNPHALAAYYLGVFSIIPVLGFILGCAAITLGIVGLRKRRQLPHIRGAFHAWFGIVAGGFSCVMHLLFVALVFLPRLSR